MTDTQDPSEPPVYVPDPEKEKQAKALHFTISIIRLLGVALLMLGIAIALDRLPPVPAPAGYVLILIGLFQMMAVPLIMVRMYVKARVAEEAAQMDAAAPPDERPESWTSRKSGKMISSDKPPGKRC